MAFREAVPACRQGAGAREATEVLLGGVVVVVGEGEEGAGVDGNGLVVEVG